MNPNPQTPSALVYRFCVEHYICTTCHCRWVKDGVKRCERCNSYNNKASSDLQKKRRREKKLVVWKK